MSGSFVASSVVRHVSHVRKETDFTLELKMRSLVLMLISPDTQAFLSMTKAALALPILAVTSLVVNHFLSVARFPQRSRDTNSRDGVTSS